MKAIILSISAIALVNLLTACESEQVDQQVEQNAAEQMSEDATDKSSSEREILFYRHPMNPEITSPVPREDSMGMPYTPVYADSASGVVAISPNIVQSLGVETAQAMRGDLARQIETTGVVAYNQDILHHIHVRTPGWVKQTSIASTGERVHAGQRLFTYYAPALVTAQRDYLRALQGNNRQLINASRERLQALGMAESEIEQITQTREVIRAVGFYAPFDGFVTGLQVRHGMYLTPDMEVLSTAPLSPVWVRAEVFPQHMQWLALGQTATVSAPGLPGQIFQGELDYLAPRVDPVTRTRRARLTLPNTQHQLLPGTYVTVQIAAVPVSNAVHIPLEALIRTGDGTRVVLALGDGRFLSRQVTPGPVIDNRVVIRDGLNAGQRVVTSAQFLLDSEASLRQVDNRLDADTETASDIPTLDKQPTEKPQTMQRGNMKQGAMQNESRQRKKTKDKEPTP